jgi:uncharacterized membrane protein
MTMPNSRIALVASLVLLTLLYAFWFFPREPVALAIFGLPPAVLALAVRRSGARPAFFAGVLALVWFSHGVMVAWTRPPERVFALLEVVLSLAIIAFSSGPGLRARFAKNRPPH